MDINERIADIVARLERGETVPIAEVEELTGPLPRDPKEAMAELVRTSGLDEATIRRIMKEHGR